MTVRMLLLASTAAIGAAWLAAAPVHSRTHTTVEGVQITFLANEGVMLAADGRTVLIDALFVKYKDGFATPADSTRSALHAALTPFDSVDLVLVTHRHGDHFHPAPVAAHLRANPRATLLTSRQVVDSLLGFGPARALAGDRLLGRTVAPGTRRRDVIRGITVELLGLPHHDLAHLGFIVELGGRRVLHVGDTDGGAATIEALAALRLDTARIDVALLPQWLVTGERNRNAIARWIRPKQVVAFHVMEGEEGRATRAVQAAIPGAVTLVRSLDTRRW